MSFRCKLTDLVEQGYFTWESLCEEIVRGMSEDEAKESFEHIVTCHDLPFESDEEE
jgi:hypothetical protein